MPLSASTIAVYTGTFDPVTLGHIDIINRGRRLFDRLVIGVGENPEKAPLFAPEERVALIRASLGDDERVQVESFDGLAVHFVRSLGARVMLRGIRTLSDIEAEFTMSLANRALAQDVETVFLMSSERLSYVSSSLIKQIAQMGSRDDLRSFVPEPVIDPLIAKCR